MNGMDTLDTFCFLKGLGKFFRWKNRLAGSKLVEVKCLIIWLPNFDRRADAGTGGHAQLRGYAPGDRANLMINILKVNQASSCLCLTIKAML